MGIDSSVALSILGLSRGEVTSPHTKDPQEAHGCNWASHGTCYCAWMSIIESVVSKNRAKMKKAVVMYEEDTDIV